MQNNKLTQIKASYFKTLVDLKELFLDGNEIISIEHNSFGGLKCLDKVWVDNNRISTLINSIEPIV